MFVIFASYGNDSVALIQWAIDRGLKNVSVAYSDTGFSAGFWGERVDRCEAWCAKNGIKPHRIQSEGMLNLVKRKKGWPGNGQAFCSAELKQAPAREWLEDVDPRKSAVCLIGVRREESKRRSDWPLWRHYSMRHGWRPVWSPLADMRVSERDGLLRRAGFEPLPHRSAECWPCIPNANRSDLRMLAEVDPSRIEWLAEREREMGKTSKGNERYIFRSARHNGARGIEQVIRWAQYSPGQYDPDQDDLFCDSGMCGM